MVTERCRLVRLVGLTGCVGRIRWRTTQQPVNLATCSTCQPDQPVKIRHCVQPPRHRSRQTFQTRSRHRRHGRRPIAVVADRAVAGQRVAAACEVPRRPGPVLRHRPGQPLRDVCRRRTHRGGNRGRRRRPRAAGRGRPDAGPQRAGRAVRCAAGRCHHRPQGRRAVVAPHQQGGDDGRAGAVDLRRGRPHAAVGAAAARSAGAAGGADLRGAAQRTRVPAAGRRRGARGPAPGGDALPRQERAAGRDVEPHGGAHGDRRAGGDAGDRRGVGPAAGRRGEPGDAGRALVHVRAAADPREGRRRAVRGQPAPHLRRPRSGRVHGAGQLRVDRHRAGAAVGAAAARGQTPRAAAALPLAQRHRAHPHGGRGGRHAVSRAGARSLHPLLRHRLLHDAVRGPGAQRHRQPAQRLLLERCAT